MNYEYRIKYLMPQKNGKIQGNMSKTDNKTHNHKLHLTYSLGQKL